MRYGREDNRFDYNVGESSEIRVVYGWGSALYAVRKDLTRLHAWSDEPRHIGSQFIAVFGKLYNSLCRARNNHDAAARLRMELINELRASEFMDRDECDLRDSLVSSLSSNGELPQEFDPFGIIFKCVADHAKRLYGEDWPGRVQCLCQVIGNQPFPGSRFWINAYTEIDVNDITIPPSVRLNINPYHLNAETYSAIYAILVHECFCHVPAHRVKQGNASVFSEGFCDWAARQLFDRWLRKLDPSLEDAARTFGNEIWTVMMTSEGGNKFWRPRSVGHEAANHLVRMFMDDGATDQEAISLVINLARQLVVTEAELADKDSFVRNLGPQPIAPNLRAQLGRWRSGLADARSLLYVDLP